MNIDQGGPYCKYQYCWNSFWYQWNCGGTTGLHFKIYGWLWVGCRSRGRIPCLISTCVYSLKSLLALMLQHLCKILGCIIAFVDNEQRTKISQSLTWRKSIMYLDRIGFICFCYPRIIIHLFHSQKSGIQTINYYRIPYFKMSFHLDTPLSLHFGWGQIK